MTGTCKLSLGKEVAADSYSKLIKNLREIVYPEIFLYFRYLTLNGIHVPFGKTAHYVKVPDPAQAVRINITEYGVDALFFCIVNKTAGIDYYGVGVVIIAVVDYRITSCFDLLQKLFGINSVF